MRLETESVARRKTDDKGDPREHISKTGHNYFSSRSGPALFSHCTLSNDLTSASTRPANHKASVSLGQGGSCR